MIDDRTSNFSIPLPNQNNAFLDDVARLRSALASIDAALASRQAMTEKGAANGYAPLDSQGKVPAANLPSYVDDVLEVASYAALPATGETSKIYVTLDTGRTYRWGGSSYVEIKASPGTTDDIVEGLTNLFFTPARARAAQNIASPSQLGLVKVGSNLVIDEFGILSAPGSQSATNTFIDQYFTPTAGQMTFTVTGGYVVGQIEVFQNGVLLFADDYTATNGVHVVTNVGLTTSDQLLVRKWSSFNTALLASQAEAEAGTDQAKLMTPLRVAQRITSLLATQAEAEAGTDAAKLMTPLRIKQAIQKQSISTGDVILSARVLSAPDWLPANGSTYSKASYPALAAEIGSIPNENAGVSAGYVSAGSFATDASDLGYEKIATNGSNVWICAGATQYNCARSTNLSTWGAQTVHNATGVNCRNVTFGNGRFVLTTSSSATNKVYVSADGGLTWSGNTASGLTTPQYFLWLEYLTTASLFVGQYYTGTQFRMATSPDGVTWTDRGTLPTLSSVDKGTYVASDGYLYIGDSSGYIARTNNGTTWTVVKNTSDGKKVNAIFEIGGYIVAVGDTGYCYRSSNGTSWADFTCPAGASSHIRAGASANGMAVISTGTTGANNAYVSYDGITWTLVTVTIGSGSVIRRMQCVSGNILILCDDNSVTVYVNKHAGFSYNIDTQFITPYKNFANVENEYLNAYIKA